MSLQENQDTRSICPVKCEWTDEQEQTMVEMLDISHTHIDCHNGFVRAIWKSIANALKGTEGMSKVKTGEMCNSHWKVLSRRYKDAKKLQKESGASWNDESSMIELPTERWDEMAGIPTTTNKRLGWFRRRQFPLYDAVGAVVDRGLAKDGDQPNTLAPTDRHETTEIDQLEYSSIERVNSHSSDESDQELQQAKLGSVSPHSLSTSSMADSAISNNKSTKKRKLSREKSASNEVIQPRSTSPASTLMSSESERKKYSRSSAQLFIDSMESMQSRFLNQMNADPTTSPSGSMMTSLDYVVMAVHMIQKTKNLDTELLFKALDLFKDSPEYAAIFVGLQKEDLQIEWLKYKLQRVW